MHLLVAAVAAAAMGTLQPPPLPIDLSEPTQVGATADGTALVLRGPITDGAYENFQRALRANPKVRRVLLESGGGLMFEAERIAEAVRRHRMVTYVETLCASACTVILIAGRDRAVAPEARVGFHRPNVSLSRTPQRTMRLTRQLYERAGVADTFTARIYATPFESVWYPGVDEMIAAGVLTRRTVYGETRSGARSIGAGG